MPRRARVAKGSLATLSLTAGQSLLSVRLYPTPKNPEGLFEFFKLFLRSDNKN
jgi:hypothetical protein